MWLTVGAGVSGYFGLAGIFYLTLVPIRYRHNMRSEMFRKAHQADGSIDSRMRHARQTTSFEATYMALGWPATVAYQVCRVAVRGFVWLVLDPLGRQAFAPVARQEARLSQLRADARYWSAAAAHITDTPRERELAAELARVWDELVKEASR